MTTESAEAIFSLLVHKVAPFQFDIGYKVSSASIRDQVVRAQLVVRALQKAGLATSTGTPLLICGAGVAGLAAAMEADHLGLKFVLIEKEAKSAGILAGKGKRFVSPTMYEWPATSVDIHSYPMPGLPILAAQSTTRVSRFGYSFTAPSSINDFAKKIHANTNTAKKRWLAAAKGLPRFLPNTTISEATKRRLQEMLVPGANEARLPELELQNSLTKAVIPLTCSAILFTSGMAPEKSVLTWKRHRSKVAHQIDSETPGFWEQDKLLESKLGCSIDHPKASVLIIGGGDGAIQDALRCLVDSAPFEHALQIWEHLNRVMSPENVTLPCNRRWTSKEAILRHILTLEGYSAIGAMWVDNPQIYKDLDIQYQALADDLIALYPALTQCIIKMLRVDVSKVYLSTRQGFSKCYALNRFLIILFKTALSDPAATIDFRIIDEVTEFTAVSLNGVMSGTVMVEGKPARFDLVVARIGNPGVSYQAIGLSGIKPERIEFGRIPVPIMPPQFAPDRA